MKPETRNPLRALPRGAACLALALLLSAVAGNAATGREPGATPVGGGGPGEPFITIWKTDNPGDSAADQITLPIEGTGYDFTVDWGDGNQTPWQDGDDPTALTHTYAAPGTYSVAIVGAFPRIFFNFGGDRQKILSVEQWGDIAWSSMVRAFYGANNLQVEATDAPDLSGVTSMQGMFAVTDAFNGAIGHWDVSTVTDMTNLFSSADAFDQDLSDWDVSNVTHMREMFSGTDVFNQDIGAWDVTGVVDMAAMFRSANAFNGDIGSWDVSNVTFMDEMFSGADAFNRDIGSWDVTSVTTMSEMFFEASAFNQDISGWDVSNVTVMSYMFEDATSFNQDIGGWNVSNATAMNYMFSGATAFNQDIGGWDVSSVTNMYSMFGDAAAFDQDIGAWDVSSVDTMTFMFFRAAAFNQDIGAWDVSNVEQMSSMFREATSFNHDIGGWDVSSATDTAWMFGGATAFDQDIGGWDVSNVTDTIAMFNGATAFNQDLSGWDVSSVTNTAFMFQDASAFNQDLSGWDVSSITDMNGMFSGASVFNQDISGWDVSGVGHMVQMFQDASSFNQDISGWDVSNVSGMVQTFSGASAFDQDLGGWDISSAAFMTGLFDNSGLSTASYDSTLIGWAAQGVQADVEMGALGLAYCAGADARQSLIDDHGWNITGDADTCGGDPELSFDPASLDFGDVAVGTTSPSQSATLHNSGGGDAPELSFNDISGSGFDVDISACGASLPAGESCAVEITFTPPIEGPIEPTLVASTPGFPPALLQLSGTGVIASPPSIDVDPESLSAALLQGAAETQTLTVANVGDEELEWLVPDLSQFGDNVKALTVWDDGNGPALFVGGRNNSEFRGVARWDGTEWSLLGAGMNDDVEALTVFDGALIAAGRFTETDGVPVNRIARWDGTQWSPLGDGVGDDVYGLAVYDGALIASGLFTEAGGQNANRIARWDGTDWSPLGTGMDDRVTELTVYDGALHAGGWFTEAGGVPASRVARWDGTQWSALGAGVDSLVHAMTVYDGKLIAGGRFEEAGGSPAHRVASWDGSTWAALGTGIPGGTTTQVDMLAVFDGALIAGGRFVEAGGVDASNIARWDGSAWSALGPGLSGHVSAGTVFDGALIAGGQFNFAGELPVRGIARWDGTAWSALVTESSVCDLPSWLLVDPTEGSVAGGDAQPVSVTFDATDLPLGDHQANLCLLTNDPDAVLVMVPVDLTVLASPEADIAPTSFVFALPQGDSAEDVLDIGNVGAADLVWSIGAVDSDLVFFDDINFTVPATQFGGSVRWDTGETCECDNEPFNFNMWRTNTDGNLAFFWPGKSEVGGGGVSHDGSRYAVLGLGDTVGPHSEFILSTPTDATLDWRQVAGVDGRLGFRFVNPDTQEVNYGHARITTTGVGGHPATVVSWVYDQAGNPIAVGGCTDPADIPWLDVAPLDGTTPPDGSVPVDIIVNTAGLEPGLHQEQFCVTTNDPGAPLVAIPVELTVVGPEPIVEVTPPALELEAPQGGSDQEVVNVGNLGTADLEWSLEEAAGIAGDGIEVVEDGGFEAGTPNPFWEESSTNFGTPLCDVNCGVNGAHSGSWWAWFGGTADADETGVVTQELTLPADDSAELRFWLLIADAFTTGQLDVSLDGEVLFSVTDADAGDFSVYTEVVLDVAELADGEIHELAFEGTTEGGSGITSFFVDDVSLVVGAGGGCASPTDIPWLSATPTSGTTPPDGSVPVTVVADATDLEPGAHQARLCLTSNDPATPLVEIPVALNVTEGGGPELTFEPVSLAFGEVPVGETSAPQTATLENSGDVALTGIAFTPPGGDYAADTSACGSELAVGGSCPVSITFTPAAPGPTTATLEATSDQGASAALGLSGSGFGDSKWSWQNPLPQGNPLQDIAFLDADDGTAVGTYGAIVRTSDGGVTWVAQESGTTAQLNAVALVDALRGTAVGAAGTILATTDGGGTWVERTSGTANDLHGVAFPDADHGIAVGSAGTVLTSDDGGETWTPRASGTASDLRDVSFSDLTTGTAVGASGTILRSTDGGETWVPQASGTTNTLSAVDFTDSLTGTAVGSGGGILRTTDGGETWVPQASGVSSTLHDVGFVDAGHGWAVGFPSLILHTSDGGATWTQQPSGVINALLGVAAITADVATAVGPVGVILRTTDGGEAWENQLPGPTDTLVGVSFTDAQTGTAVGNTGTILRTTNAGNTWVPQDSGTTTALRQVFFTDADHGTVVGENGLILRTTDGGESWTMQASGTTSTLRGVDFIDTETGIVVGFDGTILTTTDGGAEWVQRVSGTSQRLYAVSFADADHGLAVGEGATVLKTTDGGVTWAPLDTGSTTNIYAGVSYMDPQTATVAGLNMFGTDSKIFRTTDGGSTWSEQEAGTSTPLNGVFFVDADRGTAVGSGGTILATTDGGATWVRDDSRTTNILYSAVFTDAGHGTAVGFGGTILRCCGTAGELSLTPDPLDFGEVPVGETGGPLALTLTNTGAVDVTVSELTGPDAPFAPAGGTCGTPPFTLTPAASCTLDFTFGPTAEGEATSELTISSDAPSSPHGATLQGIGVTGGEPLLSFAPPSLDLGDVPVGSTSPPQVASLSNNGEADATGLTFEPLGDGFVADTSDCGTELPAGASCAISVTFTPPAPGPAAATLQVDSTEGATAEAGLSGNGVGDEALTPVALEVDPAGLAPEANGLFEPGETVDVAPAWRNDGAGAQSVEGTAASFTGPAGATYTIDLDAADYGPIQPGATASCLDTGVCYRLALSDPPLRPATHWEATFDETLDDADGTARTWTLHIGASFADVPVTNPFYPAIETLLHSGITGGCTDGTYCPGGINTRAQMPVFVLRALEGADYVPPACVEDDEPFGDVPFDSPFCPWIQELAGRGIVAGCGDGDYCPGSPVTRAQMSIFLLKTLLGADYTPPTCTNVFTDVPCPSLFADWIEDLAARGITSGCTATTYCPGDPVTRAQMAVFVVRAFGLALYGP